MEWNGKKLIKNNGLNSGPLSSLPVGCITATDCFADRSCQNKNDLKKENDLNNDEMLIVLDILNFGVMNQQ